MEGIFRARLEIFNSREDIEYYEFEVFDENWNSIPFATAERIIHLPYLKRKSVDIFIRAQELDLVTYVCTKSKILAGIHQSTVVSSKICSKFK